VRRQRLIALALAGLLGAVAGCTSKSGGPGGGGNGPGPVIDVLEAKITSPADGAADVAASTEITYTAKGAATTAFKLVNGAGQEVAGDLRSDGSSWVPKVPLEYGTKYTATLNVEGAGGLKLAGTSTFTTMRKPGNLVGVHSYIGDDQVVGVGAPFVFTFDRAVPEGLRAGLEKRLFLDAQPKQEGSWNWFSGTEIHYRPKEHWQPGTKINVRVGTGGLPWGGGWYGQHDLTIRASVADKALLIEVDNATKKMTVTQDGTVLRTILVSLGKPSTPSSYGNMVVMIKNEWEWFDTTTFGIPPDSPGGYRTKVYWPMRLTWGGEYIHAAPWSVDAQGRRNVSHGCVNMSTANAKWLWDLVHIGDPVVVKGTEHKLDWGNGWTDWDRPWDEYVKGSAL